MLRRLATILLTLAVALSGLTSGACASAGCSLRQQRRMHCCEDGLRAARSCCEHTAQKASPQASATLERPTNGTTFVALPLAPLAIASGIVDRGPRQARPIPISHAPPPTLIAQHTSLLL